MPTVHAIIIQLKQYHEWTNAEKNMMPSSVKANNASVYKSYMYDYS